MTNAPKSRGGRLGFERLQAWNACHSLVLGVYKTTSTWPREERYGLTAQVREAAISASANIAEGAARRGSKEFRRFLDIAIGSLAELRALLRLAADLGYMDDGAAKELEILRDHGSRLTWGLYDAVAKHARGV